MREYQESVAEILLIGYPNAGKSTLFNKLTGGHAKVGNWHGVTVGMLEKMTKIGGKNVKICDLPGIYSSNGMSMEEKNALSEIRSRQNAMILFVCECSTLTRTLPLFQELSKGKKCALVLTKKRRFLKRGGFIRETALSKELGIPVLDAEKPKRILKDELEKVLTLPAHPIGEMKSYRPQRGELTRTERLFLNGFFSIPLFFILMLACFYVTFAPNMPGQLMKQTIERFFSGTLSAIGQKISSPVLRGFVCDGLFQSLGSVFCFLPQIILLFFFLVLMEESGFLSRLAYLTDGFFSKFGLSGRAMFSLLMGFGCSAAAILTTRGLDDKKIQKRVILCLPYISCSAKLPVFLTLSSSFFENPFFAVGLLYILGVGISLMVAMFLKKDMPIFLMELAPLQIPSFRFVLKSLCFQVKQFIIKLATVILAFFLASWILSSFNFRFEYCAAEESMLAYLCRGFQFLFAPIGMNDWKIAYAAFSGLIAKENVAGTLAMFYGGFPYSAESAFSFAVFILTCSPCVSAIAASARELGWKSALINALVQTVTALILSYIVYYLLKGGGVTFVFGSIPAIALILLGKKQIEKIHRKRGVLAQKLHR